jgi:hypothetical protein
LLAEREQLFQAKVVAEQDGQEEPSEQEESQPEDDSELNSGWEEASEGASDFEAS